MATVAVAPVPATELNVSTAVPSVTLPDVCVGAELDTVPAVVTVYKLTPCFIISFLAYVAPEAQATKPTVTVTVPGVP